MRVGRRSGVRLECHSGDGNHGRSQFCPRKPGSIAVTSGMQHLRRAPVFGSVIPMWFDVPTAACATLHDFGALSVIETLHPQPMLTLQDAKLDK